MTALVSILMVARDAAPYIGEAILSVLQQTADNFELIVVDDGSQDSTLSIMEQHARSDSRIRIVHGERKGLSAVRNLSLRSAQTPFALIMDSDDLLHPKHLENLIVHQRHSGAEICSTNMLTFQQEGDALEVAKFAEGGDWEREGWISPEVFLRQGMIGGKPPSLGYLKPFIQLDYIEKNAIFYDERLRVGEDFDLIMRLLLAGAKYRYLPQATYYYRKHAGSVSHRLAYRDVEGLLHASQAYASSGLRPETLQARVRNLTGVLHHLDTISALKSGRSINAVRHLIGNWDGAKLSLQSAKEAALKRLYGRSRVGLQGLQQCIPHRHKNQSVNSAMNAYFAEMTAAAVLVGER